MTTWLIIAVVKLKPEKNSGLNGIRTHDLCDTSAVLYQHSHQAIWEPATLWVRNIPLDSEVWWPLWYVPVHCSNKWAFKPSWSWSLFEFEIIPLDNETWWPLWYQGTALTNWAGSSSIYGYFRQPVLSLIILPFSLQCKLFSMLWYKCLRTGFDLCISTCMLQGWVFDPVCSYRRFDCFLCPSSPSVVEISFWLRTD